LYKKYDVYLRRNKYKPKMQTERKGMFENELKMRARLFKALAHPARLAILQYLANIKTCITGDIAEELPLSRTTVNQHLKELKDAGLISGTVDGVRTNYCLNARAIEMLRKESDAFLAKIDVKKTYC
jgi:ArsR family transcriptional regulator, arsenate/arsenite/antimonite-responsive transcriptional repressor